VSDRRPDPEESQRMNRLIGNLLDNDSGGERSVAAQKEWQPLEEPVGVALIRLGERLRRVSTET